jgi:hypothetical protein
VSQQNLVDFSSVLAIVAVAIPTFVTAFRVEQRLVDFQTTRKGRSLGEADASLAAERFTRKAMHVPAAATVLLLVAAICCGVAGLVTG